MRADLAPNRNSPKPGCDRRNKQEMQRKSFFHPPIPTSAIPPITTRPMTTPQAPKAHAKIKDAGVGGGRSPNSLTPQRVTSRHHLAKSFPEGVNSTVIRVVMVGLRWINASITGLIPGVIRGLCHGCYDDRIIRGVYPCRGNVNRTPGGPGHVQSPLVSGPSDLVEGYE